MELRPNANVRKPSKRKVVKLANVPGLILNPHFANRDGSARPRRKSPPAGYEADACIRYRHGVD